MARNIIAQAVGGQKRVLENVSTVGEARSALGLDAAYSADVNGTGSKPDSFILNEGDFVAFAPQVKGA